MQTLVQMSICRPDGPSSSSRFTPGPPGMSSSSEILHFANFQSSAAEHPNQRLRLAAMASARANRSARSRHVTLDVATEKRRTCRVRAESSSCCAASEVISEPRIHVFHFPVHHLTHSPGVTSDLEHACVCVTPDCAASPQADVFR